VTTTEGDDVEVDGEVMAELIQIFVTLVYVTGWSLVSVADTA
jgi:hypothetical protein